MSTRQDVMQNLSRFNQMIEQVVENQTFIYGIIVFVAIIMVLVLLILTIRFWLRRTRQVNIIINQNNENPLKVETGDKLLQTLAAYGINLPTACGGNGTCGQCKLVVLRGGGPVLPPEQALLSAEQLKQNYRLACQVTVDEDLYIEIPVSLLKNNERQCTVRSNRSVATFINELLLDLPDDQPFEFRAGQYILLEAPPIHIEFKNFTIAKKFRPTWDHLNLWRYQVDIEETMTRAYSMANYPDEKGFVMLNIRIALPPANQPELSPGKVSSYVFSLKKGDKVRISGPYGDFFVQDSNREMIFVGGGSGMAPMRSHIFDQLKRVKTRRKISYWYGARSLAEVFYRDDFDRLAQTYDNFSWVIGLSEPQPEDHWQGPVGFIHQILFERYLKQHPASEDCEYYLCGPPPMIQAVQNLLNDLGVDEKNIRFDKFGG
jgi:Na+-transporting NADH:ubiquinone oxidoreductase subunit F